MNTSTLSTSKPARSECDQSQITLAQYYREAGTEYIPDWADAAVIRIPSEPYRPFAHQVDDLRGLINNTRFALWNEPGAGKTLPALAYALWLTQFGNKTILIMPPVLIGQCYAAMTGMFSDALKHVSVATYTGQPAARLKLLNAWQATTYPDILMMGYRMFAGVTSKRGKANQERSKSVNLAHRWTHADWKHAGYSCLIVDEAHAVKTPSSQLHKAVKAFAGPDTAESNGLVLLSGSPIENTPLDAYGLISLLNPWRYGSIRNFKAVHCLMSQGDYPTVVGFVNIEALYKNLYERGRRVIKKEVLDLPPLTISEIPVTLSDAHQALYRKLVKERVLEVHGRIIDATVAASLRQKMQQILMNPEVYSETPPKENALLDTLDETIHSINPAVNKVVVFVYYKATVEKLVKHYARWNPACIYGGLSTDTARQGQIRAFLKNDLCRVLIAQIRSGGVGLNLQSACSYAIVAEHSTIPGQVRQALDRLHRSGQENPVTAYFLTVMKTVSVTLRNQLAKKDDMAVAATQDDKATFEDLMGANGIQGVLA